MSLFSKTDVMTGKPFSVTSASNAQVAAEAADDPLVLLDRIIDELERTRADALRIAGSVTEEERHTLHEALKELELRLAEARERRDDVRQRVARTQRIRTLAAEMSELREEALLAARGEIDAERAAKVRARIEEIRIEAEGLKSGR